jgi:hypothetical protein
MRRPMLPLANGVAILDGHTRLTRLQTDVPLLLATLGAAVGRCIFIHLQTIASAAPS